MTNDHRPFADEGEVIESLRGIRAQIASMDARQSAGLARVEEQTTKTNGRVNSLEQFRAQAMAVIALVILQTGWLIALMKGWV